MHIKYNGNTYDKKQSTFVAATITEVITNEDTFPDSTCISFNRNKSFAGTLEEASKNSYIICTITGNNSIRQKSNYGNGNNQL